MIKPKSKRAGIMVSDWDVTMFDGGNDKKDSAFFCKGGKEI